MVFIPIARGKNGDCNSTESINNGTMPALQILKPVIVFPMHIQCDNLKPYKEFGKQVKKRFPSIVTKVPLSNNHEFAFSTWRIREAMKKRQERMGLTILTT